ncbi:MAG: DUF3540 domain-containing protein [Polyangiaceae bacterium]|nr:DUF3540 domain-containing protein [Polyangiaceae bacterium]
MSNAPVKAANIEPLSQEAPPSEAPAAPDPSMSRIESLLSPPEVRQTYGAVEGRDGAAYLIRVGAELVSARRAKGCLLEPETGDTVLVARSEHHGSFVLSVLIGREEGGQSVLAVEGDLTLRSKSGRVDIVGGEGVSVTSGGDVAGNAPSVTARTMNASVFADTLSYFGRKVEAQVDTVRLLGQTLESVIDHVSSRVKHSFRTIDEIERVKAKELHVNAEATLNLHGKNTLMTAEKLVKLDGEQISLG